MICLLWGGAALAFGTFIWITRELGEGEIGPFDTAFMDRLASFHTPSLISAAVDITALGSSTLVISLSALLFLLLLQLRDRLSALQVLAASTGAGLLTFVTKNSIERVRPLETHHLIVVSGFSYPSGHSLSTSALYLTIAMIAWRHLQPLGARVTILLAALMVSTMVAASRVFLEVHYATDVASGCLLGIAWALLLNGCAVLYSSRSRH